MPTAMVAWRLMMLLMLLFRLLFLSPDQELSHLQYGTIKEQRIVVLPLLAVD